MSEFVLLHTVARGFAAKFGYPTTNAARVALSRAFRAGKIEGYQPEPHGRIRLKRKSYQSYIARLKTGTGV